MPELPEAEHTRRIFERIAVGRRIIEADVLDDPIVFEGLGPEGVRSRLEGRTVAAAHRRGKYLWLELSMAPHLVLHLGMTGQVRFQHDDPLKLEASPDQVDRTWPPRFTRLRLVLDDGGELAFTNARRLGRALFRTDPRREKPLAKLGFDPLLDMPDRAAFRDRLARRSRAVLKSLLLDQGFAAGVGNWIADEVCYQAGLDPHRRVGSLEKAEVDRLRDTIEHVIVEAVRVDARKVDFPEHWLFHRRWGRDPEARTHDGEPLAFDEIGGRTTAWVPSRQR